MAKSRQGHAAGMPFDVGTLSAAYERNLNAWMTASKMMTDGIQAAAERHMKFTQEVAGDMMGGLDFSKTPAEFDLQQYLAKMQERVDAMMADAREMQEIVVKAQTEALQTMYATLTENLKEAGVPADTISTAVSDAMAKAETIVGSVAEQLKPAPGKTATAKPAAAKPAAARPRARRSGSSDPA